VRFTGLSLTALINFNTKLGIELCRKNVVFSTRCTHGWNDRWNDELGRCSMENCLGKVGELQKILVFAC